MLLVFVRKYGSSNARYVIPASITMRAASGTVSSCFPTRIAHVARSVAGIVSSERSYGATDVSGLTSPCFADKIYQGQLKLSAYWRALSNHVDVYRSRAAQGMARFCLTQDTKQITGIRFMNSYIQGAKESPLGREA